jgi:hypothetical protein
MVETALLGEFSLRNLMDYLASILDLGDPSVTVFARNWLAQITICNFLFLSVLALIVGKVSSRSIVGVYLVSFLAAVSTSKGSPLILAAITFKLFTWTAQLKAVGSCLSLFGRDGTPLTKRLAEYALVILSGIVLVIVAVAFVREVEDASNN